MKINAEGVHFIANAEGFRGKAYVCPAGKLTIGYGHVIGPTEKQRFANGITKEEAEALLERDLEKYAAAVNKFVQVALSQGQFNSLVSFCFNVGITAFARSTLLRKLNDGDYEGAAGEFQRWVNGGGRRLGGLVKRRQLEALMFRGK